MSEEISELEAVSEETGTSEFDDVNSEELEDSEDLEASSDDLDEGTSEEVQEDLIPGRFKHSEADKLAKSYRELEADYSRTKNEIYLLKQQISQKSVDPKQRAEQFANELKKDPVKAIEDLSKNSINSELNKLKQAQFKAIYDNMSVQLPDFKDLEPTMEKIAVDYQDIIVKAGIQHEPVVLDLLYTLAKGMKANEQVSAAEQAGRKKGQKASAKKRKARLEGASSGKGKSKVTNKKLSLDELRAEIEKGNLG